MAIPGTKPKPDGEKVTRHASAYEWVLVPEVPYAGDKPSVGRLPARSKAWWAAVSVMPHCILWDATTWQLAVDTAHAHANWVRKGGARPGELRLLEAKLGTTADARRDLRIRYVPAAGTVPVDEDKEGEAKVSHINDERRRRLLGE